jgi:hypothetical protein
MALRTKGVVAVAISPLIYRMAALSLITHGIKKNNNKKDL